MSLHTSRVTANIVLVAEVGHVSALRNGVQVGHIATTCDLMDRPTLGIDRSGRSHALVGLLRLDSFAKTNLFEI